MNYILMALISLTICLPLRSVEAAQISTDWSEEINVSNWKIIPHGQARWIIFDNSPFLENKKIKMALQIKLDEGWHTYWRNPGDSGAPPEVYSQSGAGESTSVGILYPFPKRIDVGPLVTYGYENKVIYFLNSNRNDSNFIADLLVCKEECVPGSIDLKALENLAKVTNENFKIFVKKQVASLPKFDQGQYVKGLSQVDWSFVLPSKSQVVDFFWSPEVLNNLNRPSFVQNKNTFKFFTSQSDLGPNKTKSGLVVYKNGANTLSKSIKFNEESPSFTLFFLMAFVGGLILNLMPCVFPIVSLKAFSILKTSGQELSKVRRGNLAYSLGVVTCFILMGLLLSFFRASGLYLGWGFQLQNPYVVVALAFIFFVLGLSFFDIWSWNWVPDFAKSYYTEDSLMTSFLTGLLAVVVASPCTAPFMGAAIGFAITQSTYAIFIVFLGLGLGMSFPFLLMAMFPSVSRLLPRPGSWMVYFKKAMGVMLLVTVIWLLWIFMQLVQTRNLVNSENWISLNVENWAKLTENTDKPRFINFTADWCVTCKVNERLVFSQNSVRAYVSEKEIAMYKVDWTKREDQIARKLAEFGRAGVPLYLFYPKGSKFPIVISELLTPAGFLSKLNDEAVQ